MSECQARHGVIFKVCIAEGGNNDYAVYVAPSSAIDIEARARGVKLPPWMGEALKPVLEAMPAIGISEVEVVPVIGLKDGLSKETPAEHFADLKYRP